MKMTHTFERVVSDRFAWITETTCLKCGRPFTVRRGDVHLLFRVHQEPLGVLCEDCLSDSGRAKLRAAREAVSR